jgi:hypothetical protein
MLLRLSFYEAGTGKQYKHQLRRRVLDEIPPARIHVFRLRLPMMHRAGWEGRKSNSGMAFGWFVWDRSHTGPTTIDRISWQAERNGDARRTRSRPARPRGPTPRTADLFSFRQGGSGEMPDIPAFLRRAP